MNQRQEAIRAVQELAVVNAEEKINFTAIMDTPSVVIDLLAADFWTTLANSPRRQEGVAKIKEGTLIPVNGDALTDLTQAHATYHLSLRESGKVNILPTFISLGKSGLPFLPPKVMLLDNPDYEVPTVPNVYVRKRSFDEGGSRYSHAGEGITMVRAEGEEELFQHFPRHIGEFLQPFIRPPAEKDGTAYVRDIRIFMIGGKPVTGLVRRAQRPLFLQNLRGEVVPKLDQIYTAKLRGPREQLEEPLRSRAFHKAQVIHEILTDKLRDFSQRPYSTHSPAGYLSIDFLVDANLELLPVDCDVQPQVDTFQKTDMFVAKQLADYLVELAQNTGESKQVVVTGTRRFAFIERVYQEVKNAIGEQRTMFVESLLSQAVQELTERAQNQKTIQD